MPAKPSRPRYHHGNLRPELIQAGLRLIEKKGVRALTLREIGAQVGVSRMAAYRHFKDKADLLAAISEAGFTEFADALDEARNKAGSSSTLRIAAMAQAYVRFASDRPAILRLCSARRPAEDRARRGPGFRNPRGNNS